MTTLFFNFLDFLNCSHVVCLYQKSVRVWYWTHLQSSETGFLMPNQRHCPSLYSYSLELKMRHLYKLRINITIIKSWPLLKFNLISLKLDVLNIRLNFKFSNPYIFPALEFKYIKKFLFCIVHILCFCVHKKYLILIWFEVWNIKSFHH